MKNWPTDPLRQHGLFIAAFCDDLFDRCVNGGTGTPRANRIAEISRQVNKSKGGPATAEQAAGND